MLRSEKKSLTRFLLIYIVTTMALMTLASTFFYTYEKHRLLDLQRESLKQDAQTLENNLRDLHQSSAQKLAYPIAKTTKSAIFDINQSFIFGDLAPFKIDFKKPYHIINGSLYHIKEVSPYYLGAAFIMIEKPLDTTLTQKLFYKTLLFLLFALFLFLILGYFLGKLFTAPMRQSFETMNRFIQDTTHELNTPISTILTNIELLDTLYDCEGKEERKRIEIASKTLSQLYDDMTYLKLDNKHHRDIKQINISTLLEERLLYFSSMLDAKKISLTKEIAQNITVMIDYNDAIRLVDNLLSNAIKYNKKGGTLSIILDSNGFMIKDTGIGMGKQALKQVFERYKRANESEGGFGIGMNIVHQIVTFYNFKITLDSKISEGTKVNVKW